MEWESNLSLFFFQEQLRKLIFYNNWDFHNLLLTLFLDDPVQYKTIWYVNIGIRIQNCEFTIYLWTSIMIKTRSEERKEAERVESQMEWIEGKWRSDGRSQIVV